MIWEPSSNWNVATKQWVVWIFPRADPTTIRSWNIWNSQKKHYPVEQPATRWLKWRWMMIPIHFPMQKCLDITKNVSIHTTIAWLKILENGWTSPFPSHFFNMLVNDFPTSNKNWKFKFPNLAASPGQHLFGARIPPANRSPLGRAAMDSAAWFWSDANCNRTEWTTWTARTWIGKELFASVQGRQTKNQSNPRNLPFVPFRNSPIFFQWMEVFGDFQNDIFFF